MSQFKIDKIIEGLAAMKEELPTVLANQAQNFFVNNFDKQGFDDGTVKKWAEVQRRIPGTKAYMYPKGKDPGRNTRAILQGKGSGQLRKGVNNSIKSASWKLVALEVDVPYASYLNEGTSKMPQRQFMGDSRTLQAKQKATIIEFTDKAFREV